MTDETTARDRATVAPAFGATIRSVHASADNPHKTGMFVRVIRRPRGRVNSGTWWQVTDGRGDFWELQPGMCEVVPGAEVLRALAGAPTADVTDEQDDPWYCPTCDELTRSCPHLPDGMDLEAQGEMADQLAAVQAELRTECAAKKYGLWTGHVWTDDEPAARKWLRERPDPRGYELFRREVRTTAWRALDGDTTEEGR